MTTITRERVAEIIHAAGLEPCDYEEVFDSIKTGEIVAMARIALASLDAEPIAPDEIPPGLTGRGLKTASRIMSIIEHFEGLNGTDASNNLVLLAGVLAQYMLDNDVTDFDVLTGDVKISVDISFKD